MLKIAGGAYLLYLAWRIASSRSLAKDGEARRAPMTLLEAAAFQWVNPKAWVMAVTAMAVYTNPERPFCVGDDRRRRLHAGEPAQRVVWAGFGMALRGFLADPVRLKWFNIAMGVLLAATLWPMLKLIAQNSMIDGLVSISQKIASTAKKAGKPQANQMR